MKNQLQSHLYYHVMDEVVRICKLQASLCNKANDYGKEIFNTDELTKMFPYINSLENDMNEFRYELVLLARL